MQFILLLPLIVVLSVAAGREVVGPGQLDGPEAEQLQRLDSTESVEELIYDDWNSSIARAGSGTPSPLCTAAGGKCINRGGDCEGLYDPRGCGGSRFACCAPVPKECQACPVEDGFFMPTGSRQCFKFFPEPGRNWSEANDLCESEGLVIAHPYDALGFRDYVLQRYGRWAYVWVNACGDDSEIIWLDNGKILGQDSPLWRPNEPKNLTSDYCVVLAASDINWQNIPDQIYSVYERTDKFQVLCELSLDTTTPPNTNSSTAVCDPACINGYCSATNKCNCDAGWKGDQCDIPICNPDCLNGGTCVAPDTCSCTAEWHGDSCQHATCNPNCLNGGMCVAPDRCSCTCLNGGTCVAHAFCSCTDRWTGVSCQDEFNQTQM